MGGQIFAYRPKLRTHPVFYFKESRAVVVFNYSNTFYDCLDFIAL